MTAPPRLVVFAGSTAPDSPASLLAAAFARELAFLDAEPTLVSLADYPLPLFDPEQRAAVPTAARQLRFLLDTRHAAFLAAPSLVGGLPAMVHNVIEWLAATRAATPSASIPFALAATAEAETDAIATLAELENAVLRRLGSAVVGRLSAGRAMLAFDGRGRIDEPRLAVPLQRLARQLVDAAQLRVDSI